MVLNRILSAYFQTIVRLFYELIVMFPRSEPGRRRKTPDMRATNKEHATSPTQQSTSYTQQPTRYIYIYISSIR